MKYKHLMIEKKEYVLLKRLMNLSGYYKDETLRKSVKKIIGELETAQILDDAEMPDDIVRFNSLITIEAKDGWSKTFQLVLPVDSNFKEDKISILTPMGVAVMGYATNDTVVLEFSNGVNEHNIKKVIQKKTHLNLNMVL